MPIAALLGSGHGANREPDSRYADRVATLVAITVRFDWPHPVGAGLELFATGSVIVILAGFVLSALWGGPDATDSGSPSEPSLEWLAFLTVLVTSNPLILCGLGMLVSVVVSRTRGGPYEETPAAY